MVTLILAAFIFVDIPHVPMNHPINVVREASEIQTSNLFDCLRQKLAKSAANNSSRI